MIARATLAAALAVAPAGCGDATTPFEWQIDLHGLDGAVLTTWTAGDATIAAGADPAGWLLECTGAMADCDWREAALPDDTGMLWWTWAERADTTAWAVGGRATIVHRDPGGAWTRDDLGGLIDPTTTLYGVWGQGDTTWVVGGVLTPGPPPGVVLRHDAQGWALDQVADEPLFKVWGSGAGEIWVVGERGTILERDAAGVWWSFASGVTDRLIAVSGRAADDVYAVGGNDAGLVLHFAGRQWSRFADSALPLSAVWTAPGRALYVGGAGGVVERFGATDTADPDPAARASTVLDPGVDIHSLAGSADRVVAVGADLHGGGTNRMGLVASHGLGLGGSPPPDGPPDASEIDADHDAPVIDAAPPPPDADGPANGEPCQIPSEMVCATGFTCLPARTEDDLICTQFCSDMTDCTAYGSGACCAVGFPQVGAPYCLPAEYCP